MSIALVKEWKRPDKIGIDKEPGWRYRWVRKDQVNRRLAEGNGWEFVRDVSLKDQPETLSMDGANHYRNLILMRLPEDLAQQRDQFYVDKFNRRLRASAAGSSLNDLTRRASAGLGEDEHGNPAFGMLGRTVIKDGSIQDGAAAGSTTVTVDPSGEVRSEDVAEMVEVKQRILNDEKLEDNNKKEVKKQRGRPRRS